MSETPRTDAATDFTAPEKLHRLCEELETESADLRRKLEEVEESRGAIIDSWGMTITELEEYKRVATELAGALEQALRQWRGYAEGMIHCEDDDYHIPTAKDLEGQKFREGLDASAAFRALSEPLRATTPPSASPPSDS